MQGDSRRDGRGGTRRRRPVGAAALAVLVLVLAAACGDRVAVPSGFGPLELGEEDHCAIVNGRFEVQEPLVRWGVVARVLPYDSTRGPLEAFSLLGNADQSLRLIAWSDGIPRDTVRLVRNQHYRCSERRVVLDLPASLPDSLHDEAWHAEGRHTRANRLALALGAEGALTAEFSHETYAGIPVWCGDGCQYVAVPFSSQTTHVWTRAYPLVEDGRPAPRRWRSPEEQARLDRVAAEERALEQGLPVRESPATRQLRERALAREQAVEAGTVPPA